MISETKRLNMKYITTVLVLLVALACPANCNLRKRELDETCEPACHATMGECISGHCYCKKGYTGDGIWSCQDIDECKASNPCNGANMYCVDHDPPVMYECGCNKGFEKVLPESYSNPDIPKEYRPVSCKDVDECEKSKPCNEEHGVCTNLPGSYSCACEEGWEGDGFDCTHIPIETQVDPCETKNCNVVSQKCVLDGTTAVCECLQGFFSPSGYGGGCQDVDECFDETHLCHKKAFCNNTLGGYNCTCSEGWEGDGFDCQDVDECALGLLVCPTNYTCANRPGTAICSLDTPAPTPSPTTSSPSSFPTSGPQCSSLQVDGETHCGVDKTPYGCSCSNTCTAEGTCCWDFGDTCAGFPGFSTTSVDIVVAGSALESVILKCGGTFLGRGINNGCGPGFSFSTLPSSEVSCDCLTLQVIGSSGDVVFDPVSVYYNGISVLTLPVAGQSSYTSAVYSLAGGCP